MKRDFMIATRQSQLALWQAEHIATQLGYHYPEQGSQLLKLTTRGDQILDRSLAKIGGKGLFLKELQRALLAGEADLAVHSLKDMPAEPTEKLVIAAMTERVEPRDCLISASGETFAALPAGARIGTSSLRRATQLLRLRPDLKIVEMRGNVNSRLDKLAAGSCDALVLAAAGLIRLGMQDRIHDYFSVEQLVPAAGQGILAIECLAANQALQTQLQCLADQKTSVLARAERAVSRRLGATCQVPLGVHAKWCGTNEVHLTAMLACPNSDWYQCLSRTGQAEQVESMGVELAEALLAAGGQTVLQRLLEQG